MTDKSLGGAPICYCTNVHPGNSWEEIQHQLLKHSVKVREYLQLDTLPIGLWLPAHVARELLEKSQVPALKSFLADNGLRAVTFNGFPYGNFHGEVVKKAVYEPDWTTERRLLYTLDLATILAELMEPGEEASISTLPIGWPSLVAGEDGDFAEALELAADNLIEIARHLHNFAGWHGKAIHIDLEPEPGCILQRSRDLIEFHEQFLLGRGYDDAVRHHIGVCHDICHAAVMFEDQEEALLNYAKAGIYVGKVQVSSALRTTFAGKDITSRIQALGDLAEFAEDRYLHQTMLLGESGAHEFHEDLPSALDALGADGNGYVEARTHFHVPIFLSSIDSLSTTRDQIVRCLQYFRSGRIPTIEIETYAWGVLPIDQQLESLAEGIAEEFAFLADALSQGGTN
jgi:sugar phosphate isomerase/epimerase